MQRESVYHEGERLVQERAGERFSAMANGQVIDSTIPRAALGFVRQQPMAVLTTVDAEGRPWPSLLVGRPGFLSVDEPRHLVADLSQARPHSDDPLVRNIGHRPEIGMLFIELATRRRLRVNGRGTLRGDDLHVEVTQAYPNCPKYIQRRHLRPVGAAPDAAVGDAVRGSTLAEHQEALIARADTLFVSSLHPEHGADASHRGGKPGFIRALSPSTLRIPDYAGNSMFNTLGNFAAYPRAGILVPDFEGRRTLQLVGEAETRWDLQDPERLTGGTGRFWDFHIEEVLDLPSDAQSTWEYLDPSPFNP